MTGGRKTRIIQMLNPFIWGGVRPPAGYQEAETVNQPLMAAQQINEAS